MAKPSPELFEAPTPDQVAFMEQTRGLGYRPPLREWTPAGRCGCGECRFHGKRHCPQADSPEAITLWASRRRSNAE